MKFARAFQTLLGKRKKEGRRKNFIVLCRIRANTHFPDASSLFLSENLAQLNIHINLRSTVTMMNQKILLLDDEQARQSLQLRNCMKAKTVEESLKTDLQTTARKAPRGELSVSFSDVEVRSHEIILGDNPAVSKGPPLTIDWDAFKSTMCSVDKYEQDVREPTNCNYTHEQDVREPTNCNYTYHEIAHEMKMPSPVRFDLLSRTTPIKDIAKRMREANEVKKKRAETRSILHKARRRQEKLKRFTRGLKNLLTNKKKKECKASRKSFKGT